MKAVILLITLIMNVPGADAPVVISTPVELYSSVEECDAYRASPQFKEKLANSIRPVLERQGVAEYLVYHACRDLSGLDLNIPARGI